MFQHCCGSYGIQHFELDYLKPPPALNPCLIDDLLADERLKRNAKRQAMAILISYVCESEMSEIPSTLSSSFPSLVF